MAKLHGSPLNPRKHFNPAGLDELAESIAGKGILQNLVARPHPQKAGDFEIVAGERRWRAAALLVARQRVAADYAVPVAVRPCSDLELLQLAIIENVDRNDLRPMEEADAFAQLVAMKQSTEAIAKAIGRTQRFVQIRLNLLAKLHPKAQAALRDGAIGVDQARALMMGPPKRQEEVLANILEQQQRDDDWARPISVAEIKRMMRRDMVRVTAALFDLVLYKGPIVEDPDDEARRYFGDVGAFEKLQNAELQRRKGELAKKGAAFVEQVEMYDVDQLAENKPPSGFRKAKKDEAAGAVIALDKDGGVKVIEGVVKMTDRERFGSSFGGGAKRKAPPKAEMSKPFLAHCRNRKTEAVQAALAADPLAAKRVLCAALIVKISAVTIEADAPTATPVTISPALIEAAKPWRKTLAGLLGKEPEDSSAWRPVLETDYVRRSNVEAEIIRRIGALDAKALDQILALLVANHTGSWWNFEPRLGDDEDFVAIARLAGADMAKAFKLDASFLAACGKPQLLRIAADLGIATGDPAKTTAAKLREAILGPNVDPKHRDAYLPPWVRIGVEKDLQAILDKKPARAAGEAAKPAHDHLIGRARKRARLAAEAKAAKDPRVKPGEKKVSRGVVAKGKRK